MRKKLNNAVRRIVAPPLSNNLYHSLPIIPIEQRVTVQLGNKKDISYSI